MGRPGTPTGGIEGSSERFDFRARVVHWRGPAPFVFAEVPRDVAADIAVRARELSYGWGVVPVGVELSGPAGIARATTSLFPRDGGYLVPLKIALRRPAGLLDVEPGTVVEIGLALG